MISFLTALRSKVVQFLTAFAVVVMLLLKVREGIREDAMEDAFDEMEKRDEQRAQSILDRVDDVPDVVQLDPTDNRGYRD
jgi:hypothetical protein